jgi:hypothetical protein
VRAFDGYSSHSFLYVMGNRGVTLFANIVFNVFLHDIMTCHKVIRTDLFQSLPLRSPGFAIEPEITARLLQRGERIFEIPVHYRARATEEGKKLTAYDGVRVIAMLLRCRFTEGEPAPLPERVELEPVSEQPGRPHAGVSRADHEDAPGRSIGDDRHRIGGRQLRRGDQCGELRRGRAGVLRPAAGLADVDEADRPFRRARCALGLIVQREEEPALLRARHQQVVGAFRGTLESAGLAPAQGRMDGLEARARISPEGLAQGRPVQRHRLVAVADQGRHRRAIQRAAARAPIGSRRTVPPRLVKNHRD